MIGKLVKGRGARGLCAYLLGPKDHNGDTRERVAVLGGTLVGQTVSELTHELGQLHDLRPGLGVHIAHQSLRVAEDERSITDDEWRAIGDRWARGMGFEGFAIVSHGDHIHLACSRVRLRRHDCFRRSRLAEVKSLIRGIEAEFGLPRLDPRTFSNPTNR